MNKPTIIAALLLTLSLAVQAQSDTTKRKDSTLPKIKHDTTILMQITDTQKVTIVYRGGAHIVLYEDGYMLWKGLKFPSNGAWAGYPTSLLVGEDYKPWKKSTINVFNR